MQNNKPYKQMMNMPMQSSPMMSMPMQNQPMMNMQMQCSPMMNMPMQYAPMMNMPQEQLESMYPRCYYIINPEVELQCDMMCSKYGTMHTPSRQQMDNMVDEIDNKVGSDVDAEYQAADNNEDRQFEGFGGGGFGGGHHGEGGRRPFRRDLISILFLRELLRRRRPNQY
ncbi:MAG TPA: hypothetical protein VIK78_20650 [Ruminiclostridium sp.]